MLLGVVSDTHGQVENARAAVRMLESLQVDCVLHCGDVGSAEIVPLLAAWPTHFVLGNVDDPAEIERAVRAAGKTCHGRFGSLELEGVQIAFLHGDDQRRLQDEIAGGQWDLVCFGHTHRAECRRVGRTLLLNPGALYRAAGHSLAVVQLPQVEATIINV